MTIQLSQTLRKRLAWMQRVAALLVILYWVVFWAERDRLPLNAVDLELCFILPDLLWIAGSLWMASRWLLLGDLRGRPASAVAGSALVYLGLLDMMINLRHGQYTNPVSTGLLNAAVNLACLLFGLWNVYLTVFRCRLGNEE